MTTKRPTIRQLHDLTGKVAVVTGGSRGIGLSIAQRLAEAGAHVVVASRKLDVCLAVASELTEATGIRSVGIACHVGQWDDCESLIDQALREFGRLDVLVNNAGMSPVYERLDGVTEALYDKTLSVNLKGPFRLGALAGAYMAEHDGGSIINIGTAGSLVASTRELPYAMAKAGLNAMTIGLADAYAPKVRVNAILPGPFRTYGSAGWVDALDPSFVPLNRIGEPDEIGPLALHLASAASSYTTGAIIRVDGGITKKV